MSLLFIGTTELLLISGLALLLFGGKKLPEMMKGLGQGVKSFKDGMKDITGEGEEVKDSQSKSAQKSEGAQQSASEDENAAARE